MRRDGGESSAFWIGASLGELVTPPSAKFRLAARAARRAMAVLRLASFLHRYEQYFWLWLEYTLGSKPLPQFAHGRDPARRIGSLPHCLCSLPLSDSAAGTAPFVPFLSAVHSCSLIVSMALSIGLRRSQWYQERSLRERTLRALLPLLLGLDNHQRLCFLLLVHSCCLRV